MSTALEAQDAAGRARTLNVFVDQYGNLVQKDVDFIRQLVF